MSRPFAQSRLKIERAEKHIAEAGNLISRYLASSPAYTDDDVGPDNYQRFSITVTHAPDPSLSAVIGDAIHNLRSSLDLLACELVRLEGKSDKVVQFPFARTEGELSGQIKRSHFHRAGDRVLEVLRSQIKPYPEGNAVLREVHDLDIQDKHSGIIPALGYVRNESLGVSLPLDTPFPRQIAHGTYLLPPGRAGRRGRFDMPVRIVFDPRTHFADRDILETLRELPLEFARVVDAFESVRFG